MLVFLERQQPQPSPLPLSSNSVTIPPDDLESSSSCKDEKRNKDIFKGTSDFAKAYNQAILSDPTPQSISTLHPSSSSSIQLNHSNKGFQLLTRLGWKEKEGGLGKNRQGVMKPVEAKLKVDRRGLGSTPVRSKKKSAAFPSSNQQKQQQSQPESKSKRRQRAKEKEDHEQRREKKIRMLLRSDISCEFEDLYLKHL